MQVISRFLARMAALIARLWLACRLYRRLGYTWHLAWAKAERADPPARMAAPLRLLDGRTGGAR